MKLCPFCDEPRQVRGKRTLPTCRNHRSQAVIEPPDDVWTGEPMRHYRVDQRHLHGITGLRIA